MTSSCIIASVILSQVSGTWPMWGGEPTHRSVQLMKGAITSPVIKWRFATLADVEWQFSAVADCDGDGRSEVIFGSSDSIVHCLDGATGSLKWSFVANGPITSSPAIAEVTGDGVTDVIVATGNPTGTGDLNLYCLTGTTGNQQWSYPIFRGMNSAPAIADVDADGQMEVLIGCIASGLICLNGEDGSLGWFFNTGAQVGSSPAIADIDADDILEVIVGSNDSRVYCVNGQTGTEEWRYVTGGPVVSSPALADLDGVGGMEVVFGSYDGNVYCLSSSGTLAWLYDAPGGMQSASPAIADVDGDGELEVIIGGGLRVYSLNGLTGGQEWEKVFVGPFSIHTGVSLADVDTDDRFEVLVPNFNGSVLNCLNAEDGSTRWQIDLAFDVHSPFVGDIDDDGCIEIVAGTYGPDVDGYRVFALDDPSGATDCGVLYENVEEGSEFGSLEFRPAGRGIYLFLPREDQVSLSLYDASGKLVQRLYDGVLAQGGHSFIPATDGRGIHFAVLKYQGGIRALKLLR